MVLESSLASDSLQGSPIQLPSPLPFHSDLHRDLFEGVLSLTIESEPELDNVPIAWRKLVELNLVNSLGAGWPDDLSLSHHVLLEEVGGSGC